MNYGNLKYLGPLVQKEIDNGSMNGSAIRIIHNDRIIYDEEFGFADKEKGIPIRKDTIFRIYSMTKPITAVALMILYERGMVDLFDPVSDYLEGFRNQKVWNGQEAEDVKKPVTILDLLHMSSGLIYTDTETHVGRLMNDLYVEADALWKQGKPIGTVELCNRIGRFPLTFQPGEQWCYGTSADILGGLIEVVSGKKFGDFLQEEIFTPLGMTDTGFQVAENKLPRLAVLYEYIENERRLHPVEWSRTGIGQNWPAPDFESGGGGLVSTKEDYTRFASMLLNGGSYGDVRILGRKTVEYMTGSQLTPELLAYFDNPSQEMWYRSGFNYASLVKVMTNPGRAASNGSVGEFSWDGWAGTYFSVSPKDNLILLYMIQRCNGMDMSMIRKLRSIVYSSLD